MDHRDKAIVAAYLLGVAFVILSMVGIYLAWVFDNDAR